MANCMNCMGGALMDLIYADKLRADVLSWENCSNGFSDTYDKARIIDAIDEQPTIEAEPVRRGRWKHDKDDIIISGYCSECGWLSIICETDVAGMSYCPNCGAKMENNNE